MNEFDAIVDAIDDRLVQMLAPFGWAVGRVKEEGPGGIRVGFRFAMTVRAEASRVRGQELGHVYWLSRYDLLDLRAGDVRQRARYIAARVLTDAAFLIDKETSADEPLTVKADAPTEE